MRDAAEHSHTGHEQGYRDRLHEQPTSVAGPVTHADANHVATTITATNQMAPLG